MTYVYLDPPEKILIQTLFLQSTKLFYEMGFLHQKRRNGCQFTQRTLFVPLSLQQGRFLQGNGRVISVGLANRLEVDIYDKQ